MSACLPNGPELAAKFGGQILHAGEIGLHRIEFAQGFLLALSMLENPGGLLDEAPPLLRRRRQDRVELTLADDDVHLTADARVRQQLLHVEQPAYLTVDRVLGSAARNIVRDSVTSVYSMGNDRRCCRW